MLCLVLRASGTREGHGNDWELQRTCSERTRVLHYDGMTVKCLLVVFGAHRRIRVAAIQRAMAVAVLRKSSYARVAWTAALQHPETHLIGDHALNGAVRSSSSSSMAVPGSHAESTLLGRSVSTLFSNISLPRKVHWSGVFVSRSFSVGVERNGSSEGSSSVRLDDFRSLINRKKSEVAILEAALEILETAPRDKRFEDLVRKHNLQFESEKSVLVKRTIEFEPVEPTSQIALKNDVVENNSLGLEPAKTSYSQPDRSWNVAKPPPPKTDSSLMFGKLSLDDFPAPVDPSLERLQKKRRRQELLKEYERNNKRESLNFGAAAKSTVGGSNPTEEPPIDPLRPNANVFLEQPGDKPYRSLADRLYEEQFGHPAPPGLKRTYPKGSFYDRATKDKERKDREAAAASARMAARSVSASRGPIESLEETTDNSLLKTVSSNDENQERKPGAWKCPQCTFFNLAADKHCYRCQAQRGENGRDDERDSGRQSATGA